MASSRAAFAVALATLVGAFAAIDPARAFGAGAGSCEHLGVGHGVERLEPEEGIFWLKIGDSGVNVPGATIPVEIRGVRPFRGFLLRPVDGNTGEAIKNKSYNCFLKKDTTLPMMYMSDAINATLNIMQANANKIKIRSSFVIGLKVSFFLVREFVSFKLFIKCTNRYRVHLL